MKEVNSLLRKPPEGRQVEWASPTKICYILYLVRILFFLMNSSRLPFLIFILILLPVLYAFKPFVRIHLRMVSGETLQYSEASFVEKTCFDNAAASNKT